MTTVKLLNVPFESNYKDTVYFASKQEQESYMNSKVVKTFEDATYQRKDNIIRVPAHIDTLYNCNYVAYTNTPYTNKTFYAFITNMEYKQDDCTLLTIQTDVLQTWMFDFSVKESFVEREHVQFDTVGLHTVPENLETGDFTCLKHEDDPELKKTHIVMGSTVDTQKTKMKGGNYNGIYSGIRYCSYESNAVGVDLINTMIQLIDANGQADSIQCMFLAPEFLTTDSEVSVWIDHSNTVKAYQHTITEKLPTVNVRNNKCLTFPYRYLLVSNNNGGSAVYKYESFNKEDGINFSIQGALTPGCSIRLIPKNYKGLYINNEEGLNLGKYPICNWNSDVFTNWLTQNSVNIGLNVASGVAQVVGGVAVAVATGGAGVAVGGASAVAGVSAITSQLAQVHQMSFTPPQSKGNVNCGDVITASETNTFHYYQMCIKEEYMKIIDEFFQMFGYKINRVKIPEKNHRPYFWYTKTIDVNIDGPIPNDDLQKIKECYNNGITFWKPSATMGIYNVDNSPLIIDK